MATSLYRLVVSAAREHLCPCAKVILTLPWEPHRGRFCLRGSAEVTDSNLDYFTAWITSLHPFCPAGSHPHWSPSLYKVDVVSPFRTRNRNFSTGKRQSLTSNFPSDWLIGFILLADRLQNEARKWWLTQILTTLKLISCKRISSTLINEKQICLFLSFIFLMLLKLKRQDYSCQTQLMLSFKQRWQLFAKLASFRSVSVFSIRSRCSFTASFFKVAAQMTQI